MMDRKRDKSMIIWIDTLVDDDKNMLSCVTPTLALYKYSLGKHSMKKPHKAQPRLSAETHALTNIFRNIDKCFNKSTKRSILKEYPD
jgi:hypothetical protein